MKVYSLAPSTGTQIEKAFYYDLNSYLASDPSYIALKISCKKIQESSEEWEKKEVIKVVRCHKQKKVCHAIQQCMTEKPRLWMPLIGLQENEKGHRNKALLWVAQRLAMQGKSVLAKGMIRRFKKDETQFSIFSQKNSAYSFLAKTFLEQNNLVEADQILDRIMISHVRQSLTIKILKNVIFENHPLRMDMILWLTDKIFTITNEVLINHLGAINWYLKEFIEAHELLGPSPLKDQIKCKFVQFFCQQAHFMEARGMTKQIDSLELKNDLYIAIIDTLISQVNLNAGNIENNIEHIEEILKEVIQTLPSDFSDQKIENIIRILTLIPHHQELIKGKLFSWVAFIQNDQIKLQLRGIFTN